MRTVSSEPELIVITLPSARGTRRISPTRVAKLLRASSQRPAPTTAATEAAIAPRNPRRRQKAGAAGASSTISSCATGVAATHAAWT